MQKLAEGVHQFQSNYFAKHRAMFERLAEGQNPETLFITCSDSRVNPNLITNTDPGELFLVRNVGNIVPSVAGGVLGGVSAAIEYAVEVLNVTHIVVCGHTGCGAMDAILHPERVKHLPFVKRWLGESSAIRDIIAERYGDLDPEAQMNAAVEENVLVQLENLRSFSFVARRMDEGKLTIGGWVYQISTGAVYDYDPVTQQFLQITGADERPSFSSRPPPAMTTP